LRREKFFPKSPRPVGVVIGAQVARSAFSARPGLSGYVEELNAAAMRGLRDSADALIRRG